MKRHALAFLLAASFALPAFGQPKQKAGGKPAAPDAPKKELTREEIAKLDGFEKAPEAPFIDGPQNLNFEVLMVTMPEALAIPLVESFRDPAKVDAACQKLMGLIEAKKAKITGWPRLQTRSGNRAVAENIQELKYATEFSPGEAPVANGPLKAPAPAPAKTPPGPPQPAAKGVLPTSFETRNVGATLEIEPALGPDGKTMDLNICVQHVRLLGWDNVTVQESGTTKVTIPQPRFQTNKLSQNISIQAGGRLLLGTYLAPDAENQMELFILGASLSYAKIKTGGKVR